MATMNQHQQANSPLDRVSINLGRTLNVGNFESEKIDIGYSSNVNPGETPEEALKRVVQVVQIELKKQVKAIRTKYAQAEE